MTSATNNTIKINYLCDSEKEEIRFFDPFLQFYLLKFHPGLDEVTVTDPDRDNSIKNPDFFIEELEIAIEVKRMIDEKEIEKFPNRANDIKIFNNELRKVNPNFLDNFKIDYSIDFAISRKKTRDIVTRFLEVHDNGQRSLNRSDAGFHIVGTIRWVERSKASTTPGVKESYYYFDVPKPKIRSLTFSLEKAQNQLRAFCDKAKTRILLLVDFDWIYEHDYRNVIEDRKSEIEKDKSITEIWLRMVNNNQIIYTQLYPKIVKNDEDT